jgi:hypothetical protein
MDDNANANIGNQNRSMKRSNVNARGMNGSGDNSTTAVDTDEQNPLSFNNSRSVNPVTPSPFASHDPNLINTGMCNMNAPDPHFADTTQQYDLQLFDPLGI